jgi:hypothetical protein
MKFLQKYRFDDDSVHYVFEGFEDQSFYFNHLAPFSKQYNSYVSLGKSNSLDLYKKIDWSKYDKHRVLIFIDKDYSNILGETCSVDHNIYETTYYSIENYLAEPLILERLINEVYHFYDKKVISEIVGNYDLQLKQFKEKIKAVVCWILIARSSKLKANLNGIDLGKLYLIDSSLKFQSLPVDKLAYLEKCTQVSTPKVGLAVFKSWHSLINKQSSHKDYLRGKFELWFFITYFHKVNNFLAVNAKHNAKVQTFINYNNAIEIIGPRSSIPSRLQDFLQRIFPTN